MTELRCDTKLHGVLHDGILEIKCRSNRCGAGPDVVVLHQFNILTGELIKTLTFREPRIREHQMPSANRKGQHAAPNRNSVRYP